MLSADERDTWGCKLKKILDAADERDSIGYRCNWSLKLQMKEILKTLWRKEILEAADKRDLYSTGTVHCTYSIHGAVEEYTEQRNGH
jgi:hypothetical protein